MPAAGPAPIYLTILRKGDLNIVDLAEVGALIARSETQVDEAFLQELTAEVSRLALLGARRHGEPVRSGCGALQEPGTAPQSLAHLGELLFSHLLTEPARHRLRTAAPCDLYLRLDERLLSVPWELCFDGQDFVAMRDWG
jgi:hypothetical protein